MGKAAYSTWKSENVNRKAVQAGIKDQRPLASRNQRQRDWVVVSARFFGAGNLEVRGEYRTEAEARKAMQQFSRYYTRYYYCHKDVLKLMKPYWNRF